MAITIIALDGEADWPPVRRGMGRGVIYRTGGGGGGVFMNGGRVPACPLYYGHQETIVPHRSRWRFWVLETTEIGSLQLV